jgi:hypothetical protein
MIGNIWNRLDPLMQPIMNSRVQPPIIVYLTILAETGFVGFSLYMLPTLYYFIRSIFAWRKVKDKVYLSVLWMIIFMVNLAAQTADLRFFPFVLGYWWFALALVANTFQVEQ